MRLTALTLANYGPFRAQRIGFDPAPGRLNLLIAPNGAGKSVLRGAFCDLLFGIHPHSEMGFRYGYNGMRLQAEAVDAQGTPFGFGRRKGMGNTLLGADGGAMEPTALARLLGHTDKALLERLFALDTERLRAGGAELLASGGRLADALLSAAGGLRQARQLRASLDAARDALAPERKAQGRPFYQALDRLTEARRRFEANVLKPEAREKQQTELTHRQAEMAATTTRAKAASLRIAQLQRVRLVVGPLRQHDEAAAWLDAHRDAPALPADTATRLARATEAKHRADLLVERARATLREAGERAAELEFDAALLDAAEAIDAVVGRSGAAVQAIRDIPRREVELANAEADIADALHQLGLDLPVERAAEAIPRHALVAEARRQFAAHAVLRADLDRLPEERDAAQRELHGVETQLIGVPDSPDLTVAIRDVQEARRAGDPAVRAQAAAKAVFDRQAALEATLARIPHWRDRVATLPVRPLATYERLHSARGEAAGALAAAAGALARLRQEAAEEQARLAELAAGETLPDAAAIAAARARRDAGWRLIYRRVFTADVPQPHEVADWAGATPLPLAYERAVMSADAVADLRNREAERIAKAAEIGRRLRSLHGAIASAETGHAAADAAHAAARAGWREALGPLGLDEATGLDELRALLAGRDKALDAQRDLSAARAEHEALRAQHAAAAARLAEALGEAGERGHAALPALLALADERIAAAREADRARALLRERREGLRRSVADKRGALERAREHMAAAREEWARIRLALRRPDAEAPGATVALLDQFARLDGAAQAAATARQRLHEMRGEVAEFSAGAADLARRVAPDLTGAAPVAAVDALRRRLAEQRGRAHQRDELLAQVRRAEAALAAEAEQQAQSAAALRAVLAVIGADDAAEAEPLVARAAERAAAEASLRRTTDHLAGAGDGRDIAALRQEVARFDIDAIPGEIASAEAERDRAWQEAQALAARIATDSATMETQAAETAAVQAEHDRQAAVATLGRVLDDALVLQVAGLILDDALHDVDAAGTSALLARIGGLFRTLTDGAYPRIVAEDEGNGSVRLQAVERDHPDSPVAVAALSDGTRDQLFLALRLAAIEDHVAAAPPLPFVADDILQTFDDARALASMRALVELSAHVQVIVLSHHPHLLELAGALGPQSVHVCRIAAE